MHVSPDAYRDLATDFDQRYKSTYIDPVWFDVADPDKVGHYYNWTLDEMVHAARAGVHGCAPTSTTSHKLRLKNIDLFCREVLPYLEDIWDAEWGDRWWPERLRSGRSVTAAAAAES